jgi:hypothetical protein
VAQPDGHVFVTDGQLQNVLVPPRWGYAGRDGSFAVFTDHFARGPLSLQAQPGRPAAGASVRLVAGAAAVSSPHGVRVIRSVAAASGWSATWHPRRGQAAALAVHRAGLVQAVDVPPGTGLVTWSYRPPGFTAGLALSLVAAALILALVAKQSYRLLAQRQARPQRAPPLSSPAPPSPAQRDAAAVRRA